MTEKDQEDAEYKKESVEKIYDMLQGHGASFCKEILCHVKNRLVSDFQAKAEGFAKSAEHLGGEAKILSDGL